MFQLSSAACRIIARQDLPAQMGLEWACELNLPRLIAHSILC